MNTDEIVRSLLDRQLISDTIYRYASTIDRKDWEGVRQTFCDDATARYGGREWMTGAATIAAWIEEHSAGRPWAHHLMSVFHIDLAGDTAAALVYHTSHQTLEGQPDEVAVIVARYHNELRRVGEGWKLSRLDMEVGWREIRSRAASGSGA